MARAIRGIVARITYGYGVAARVTNYALERQDDGVWRVRATIITFDAYQLRQRPLIFVAPHKDGEWRWPIKTLDVGEGLGPRELRATLGPQLPELITRGTYGY
jgi:hypothetical protein